MFTIADIRDIAVQIERNGEQTYRQASRLAADPELAELFDWMADEERRHAEWFAAIDSQQELSEEQRELEQMGRQLLQSMVEGQTFSLERDELLQLSSFQELVEVSKGFEKDTMLFYDFLKGLIEDPQARRQLELIIAEEQSHYDRLDELAAADDSIGVSA